MERITTKMLEGAVKRINQLEGKPLEPWSTTKDDKLKANIGNYHLSGAYGGWRLEQMMSDGGGIRVISSGGYISKRELDNQLQMMITVLLNTRDERRIA